MKRDSGGCRGIATEPLARGLVPGRTLRPQYVRAFTNVADRRVTMFTKVKFVVGGMVGVLVLGVAVLGPGRFWNSARAVRERVHENVECVKDDVQAAKEIEILIRDLDDKIDRSADELAVVQESEEASQRRVEELETEIARLKGLASEFGKRFDTFVDWIVHAAIFMCLGWGVAEKSGNDIWFWFGVAAAIGGTINYIIDTIRDTREKAAGVEKIEDGPDQTTGDRMVFSSRVVRTDFCFIVLVLALIDAVWLLLPASAIGAQVYWCLQFVKNFRRHHV